MAETIRDVIVRISLQQDDVALKVPDTKPAVAEVNKLEEAIEDLFSEEPFENLDEALEDLQDEIKQTANVAEQSSINIGESNVKVAESFRTAGEGAFTAARGIALFAASGEEDLQQMLQTVAKVQGAFDVFKGTIDVVKGLQEGMIALNATMAATTTTAGTLKAALGPIAIAAAAVGLVFFALREDTELLEEDLEEATDALERFGKVLQDVRNIGEGPLISFQAEEGLISFEERLAILDERALDFAQNTLRLLREKLGGDVTGISLFGQGVGDPLEDLKRAEEALKGFLSGPEIATNQGELELRKAISEELLNIAKGRAQQQQAELNILREQGRQIDENLEKSKQELDTAKAKLDLEKSQLQTAKERFGALSEQEAIEVQRLAERVQAGEQLSVEEAQLLEPFAPELAQGARSRRAEQRGFGDFAQDLNLGEGVREAQEALDGLREDLQGPEGVVNKFRQMADANREAQQQQVRVLNDMLTGIQTLTQDMTLIEERLRIDQQRSRQ